jgi:hypothetical protein
MRLKPLFVSMALLLNLTAGVAMAAPLTYLLKGTVDFVSGDYSDIALGSSVDATFTLDMTQATDVTTIQGLAQYVVETGDGPLATMIRSSVVINGTTYAQEAGPYSSAQQYTVTYGPDVAFETGVQSLYETYNLVTYANSGNTFYSEYFVTDATTASAYSPDGALPQLNSGQAAEGVLSNAGSVLQYTITAESALALPPVRVPAPASAGLLLLGLFGVAQLKRRRLAFA